MVDYKELYLTLFRANELAIRQLIDAQQHCEEQYLAYATSDTPAPSKPNQSE